MIRVGRIQSAGARSEMTIPMILLPLFVQVGLTFVLLFWMGGLRVSAIRRGEVKMRDIALGQPAWPEQPTKVANSYHNQFEMPVLFYVLVVLAIIVRKADLLFVIMSWIFVLCRIVHAYIHTTSNHVGHRFYAFLASNLVLLVMWIIFAVRILVGV
jgi:hypothetical protein